MDITKFNFEEEFDNIKEAIEEATFLAIDGEFTGLNSGSGNKQCCFDTPAERYRKIINGSSDFLLIQFGLCAFKAIEEEKRYEAKPFNFYIFPRPLNHQSPDRRFLCQSSSIDFLISHDFDFNKLFKEGIPYLNYDQEVKVKEKKQADRNNSSFNASFRSPSEKKKFVVPAEHREFINSIREKVNVYLKSKETAPLDLPPCDAFQRKMIYRSLEQDHPFLGLETKTGEKKERFLQVIRCNSAEEMEKRKEEKHKMELDIQVGFSKVMKLVTESGKPVVGHNMYLDVIHSFNHFYGPVPQELAEFKEVISTVFPKLVDTKLIANTAPFKEYFLGTSLEEVRVTMKQSPFKEAQIDLPEGFSRYGEGCTAYHEAGYDAFVTGACFASLVNFLGRHQNPAVNFLLPTHHSVQPFVNKLFMMRVADIPYVNLAGPDEEPSRDNVFHVTFPEEWRSSDLYQLFEPYGNIQISWLTQTTAYVGVLKKQNAQKIIQGLCQSAVSYQIITYAAHRRMTQLKSQAAQPVSTDKTPPPVQYSETAKQSGPAGVKRRSPSPTDIVYPPTKLQRRTSVTKEAATYPSIPEEDEKNEETRKVGKPEQKQEMEEDEEEDIGVPADRSEIEKLRNGKKEPLAADNGESKSKKPSSEKDSSNNFQLFEEPDSW